MMNSDGPRLFLRYSIARKKPFLADIKNAYDGLVLPANVLLYQYKSTPSVVLMTGKPFFIDPMSYLFGQPYENFKKKVKAGPDFKPSFKKIMIGHGLSHSAFLNIDYKQLLSFLNESKSNISAFVDNCISFQVNSVKDVLKESIDLLDKKQIEFIESERVMPEIVLPPYFLYYYLRDGEQPITSEITQNILDYCHDKYYEKYKICPVILIKRSQLNEITVDKLIKDFSEYNFPGYCLWVDNFDERNVADYEVNNIIKLVRGLSKNKSNVYILHGGFFSMLLSYFGVDAVSHGLAYGEHRAIEASAKQTSGPAPVRYYVFDLHRFLTLDNALIVLRQRPDLLCNCPVCKAVVAGNPENVIRYQNEESLAEMHFLYNRSIEKKLIKSSSLQDIITHLNWSLEINDDINRITKEFKTAFGVEERPIVNIESMRSWKKGFEKEL